MILIYILFFTFIATILSLFLVAFLLLHETLIRKVSFYLVSFAAGSLLATGLTDTMPEAVVKSESAFFFVTIFIGVFFLIEKIFLSFHHHDEDVKNKLRLPVPFLMFGDALHNFIDGVSISATFLVSVPLGVVTSLAVFVHEIPHELGDFGILLHSGYSRKKVLFFNVATGVTAFAGALLGFLLGVKIEGILPILLALTTANFIYLSLSDLLPEIHEKAKGRESITHTLIFFLGILFILILEKFIKA